MALMAARSFVSRSTLSKVEKGDPTVSLGIYATVLFVLGLTDRLSELVDHKSDQIGLTLDDENLPRRVRLPSGKRIKPDQKHG